MSSKIILTEQDIKNMVSNCVMKIRESAEGDDLQVLFNYLSTPADTNIRNGKKVNRNAKAYNFFEPKGIVRDAWAVHFTYAEVFEDMIDDGFVHGCTDLDRLAYSDSKFNDEGNADTEKNYGWCFALPIDNAYKGEDCGYGDCCFLIKTDGVRAYHKLDGDDEIIFKDKYVKQRIPFMYEDDYFGWNILNVSNKLDPNNLPEGAFVEEWTKMVLFEDVDSVIKFLLKNEN